MHIDELRPDRDQMPNISEMKNTSVGSLLEKATNPGCFANMDLRSQQELGLEDKQDVCQPNLSMHEYPEQVHGESKLDIDMFIKRATLPALAMVKDSEQGLTRSTERVNIITELLRQETEGKLNMKARYVN